MNNQKQQTGEGNAPRVQVAQYGEGASKFYAAKRGPETVATYKLDYDQRQEVNQLIEEAQNDIEPVLFKLVAQRDELLAALKREGVARQDYWTFKAHAERLSEALKGLCDCYGVDDKWLKMYQHDANASQQFIHALEALAQWEEAQK
jgi:hypothetical protein